MPLKQVARCRKCNKKLGLLGFTCSCTYTFCKLCRYAEDHACTFDYVKAGKEQLYRDNPVVQAEKIVRL